MSKMISEFTLSRITGIIAAVAAMGGILADLGNLIPGRYGLTITAIGIAVTAITERVQGGKSTLRKALAEGEVTKKQVVENYRKDEKGSIL